MTLAELNRLVSGGGRVIQSFRLEAVLCAMDGERKLIALQDESATELLELPPLNASIRVGDRLVVEGNNCTLTRGRFALQLGTAPVVEIDGRHPPLTKSGSVYLNAGRQPLRVEWFNGVSGSALTLEYEGPGVAKQLVPDATFWRRPSGGNGAQDFEPGVDYESYIGDTWPALPDFRKLKPVQTGVAPGLDVSLRVRPEEVGMVFSGFLQISQGGTYTFYDNTDDGSRVYIGDPAAACKIEAIPNEREMPVTRSLQEALSSQESDQWVAAEGRATFVSRVADHLELELTELSVPVSVCVVDCADLPITNLLHQRLRVTGVFLAPRDFDPGRAARIVTVSGAQLEVVGPAKRLERDDILTTAEQIRRLQPAEARKPFGARIRGVVTMSTPGSFVVQDATGGVFVRHSAGEWINQPRPGELWEIEGKTDPGDFSPIVVAERCNCFGSAALPEPIRPTWDQLLNGGLDAEEVEIQGVVIATSLTEMLLLTRDGQLQINGHEYYPLAHLRMSEAEQRALIGSVVRLRGVFTANWDWPTGRVKAGQISMGNAMLSVDEPAPGDPFSEPTIRATDLLLFTSHASALKRVKVAGQILYARAHEYFLLDGTNGLRFLTRKTLSLRYGDQVEAVGFPRLGGPSPMLIEAQARKTGHAPIPEPVDLSLDDLSDSPRDSTFVQTEALLLSDSIRQDDRVLEMQTGSHRFIARLESNQRGFKPIVRGSRLKLKGVYADVRENRALGTLDAFELLLSGPEDIVILQQGPWWTVRHTIALVSILSGGLLLALVWVSLLRRTVAQRTTQLAKEIEERQLVEQHRIMEQERTRVAQDLHDELGSGLTEATILGSLAGNPAVPREKQEGYLMQLMEVCRSLVTGLDEIVWAVNPRYDSVSDLAGYYSLFAQRFLNLAGIICRLQVAESIPQLPLDSRLRHGIFLAFKEALNNVVRHSHATEVKLAVVVDGGELKISVADNGRGFDPAGISAASDGVAGMKQRMQNLGGNCQVNSQPGHGTTVTLSLPLRKGSS